MVRRWQTAGAEEPFPLKPSPASGGGWSQAGGRTATGAGWKNGLILALLVAAAVAAGLALAPAFAPDEAGVQHAARELPREWRWEREAISFDHMYSDPESRRETTGSR